MRDFSWKYFTMTGDVESYLLYKEIGKREAEWDPLEEEDYYQDDAIAGTDLFID